MENNFKMKFVVEEEINIDCEKILEYYEQYEPNTRIEKAIVDYFTYMGDRYYKIFSINRQENINKVLSILCNYLADNYYLEP